MQMENCTSSLSYLAKSIDERLFKGGEERELIKQILTIGKWEIING